MSAVYARAARLGLPGAIVIVDRFHLVKKANDMLDALRRRVTLGPTGPSGRKVDVEWNNGRRLLRGAERLTDAQLTTLFAKLLTADPGEDIVAAWIAKELLRDLLSCAQRGGLRHEIHTGLTNARTEGCNRIVKHIGRIAFGFRNPDNQRRRVKWACIRQSRRVTPSRHQYH